MSPIHLFILLIFFCVPIIIAGIGANACCERKGYSKGWVVGACFLPIIFLIIEGTKPKIENPGKPSGKELTCLIITAALMFLSGISILLNS